MSSKEKHLEFIQAAINRLAGNSYAYKGWALTVAAGLVAYLVSERANLILGALYPLVAFWYLDAHSLSLERAFRKLYDAARLGEAHEYTMDIKSFRRPISDQIGAMLSTNILLFYGSAAIFIVLIDGIIA